MGRVGEVDGDEVQPGGGEIARKAGLGDPCRGRSWMRHPSLAPWEDRPILFRTCVGRGKREEGALYVDGRRMLHESGSMFSRDVITPLAGFKGSFMSDLRGRDKWQASIKVSARGKEPFDLVKSLPNRLC